MLMKTAINEILKNIESATENLEEDVINSFMDILISSDNIFVIGAGRSGLAARAFAMRLMHLGLNVYVVGETISPAIYADDCILAISGSGETKSVVSAVETAKQRGSKVLSLTSYPNASLGAKSDVVMLVKGRTKIDLDGEDFIKRQIDGNHTSLTPLGTAFELTSLIFLDGLISELMYKLGKTETDLKNRHTVLE